MTFHGDEIFICDTEEDLKTLNEGVFGGRVCWKGSFFVGKVLASDSGVSAQLILVFRSLLLVSPETRVSLLYGDRM